MKKVLVVAGVIATMLVAYSMAKYFLGAMSGKQFVRDAMTFLIATGTGVLGFWLNSGNKKTSE